MINLTISIDDVNPQKGWRILGEKTEKYLFDLHNQFNVKFTLFIPSNFHSNNKISKNKRWINELKDCGIFELSAHGHFHQTSNEDKFGQMEFLDMTENECIQRLKMLKEEWGEVGISPKGWRNPGWICKPYCVSHLSNNFEWAALHYNHNHNLKWGCKTLFGADGIHENNIKLHNNNIMFQSHIFGDWNENVWNKNNYNQMCLSLDHIINNMEVKCKTLSELLK